MAQQIADYFSRLGAKRNTDENTQEDDDEEETASLENETHLQLICEKVVTNVLIQNAHPILYDAYNICELVEKSKLSSFSIRMIQDICFSFGLDISNTELSEESSSTLTF